MKPSWRVQNRLLPVMQRPLPQTVHHSVRVPSQQFGLMDMGGGGDVDWFGFLRNLFVGAVVVMAAFRWLGSSEEEDEDQVI